MNPSAGTQHAAITLELVLGPAVDNRFGLVVPELQLTIRDSGTAEVDIPSRDLDDAVAAQTRVRGSETEHRAAGTGKPVTPKLRKLPAGRACR